MDLGDLATFPTTEDDWVETVLIGGIVTLAGMFLFIPLLAVYGYMIEAMRGAVEGESEPPALDNWGDLLLDGLKAYVIILVFQIPAMVIGGGVLLVFSLIGVGLDSGAVAGIGFFLGFGLWMLLSLLAGYIGIAGVTNFAIEGSFGAAFDVDRLRTLAFSKQWVFATAFYIGMSIVASVAGILIITYPFAMFYMFSATGRAFGEAFAEATA